MEDHLRRCYLVFRPEGRPAKIAAYPLETSRISAKEVSAPEHAPYLAESVLGPTGRENIVSGLRRPLGGVLAQFLQQPQQGQPLAGRKDAGGLLHRCGVLAEPRRNERPPFGR